ncbi:MAG: hypothetical protein DWQ05_21855 [Calditrichaeota bacterium]|nr:MAG: hypothetical protein DWQ05_21855 [Calditrichota bacterium]
MTRITGLKKMRKIGDVIKSATDGIEKSLSVEEILKKVGEAGIEIEPNEIDAILAYLIAHDNQIQVVEHRFFHKKPNKSSVLKHSKKFPE